MIGKNYKSEIRDSIVRGLLDKVRKQNYEKYLVSIRMERIRMFRGAEITFDFPVTALIGPNGSGKSTVLNAAACAYLGKPESFFQKSRVGDDSMNDWQIEFDVVDKAENPKGTVRITLKFENDEWSQDKPLHRKTNFFRIYRTVPPAEHPRFTLRKKLRTNYVRQESISTELVVDIDHIKGEAEKILGKSLANFELYKINFTRTKEIIKRVKVRIEGERLFKMVRTGEKKVISVEQLLYVGSDGEIRYSEFNFGSGESSVLRIVAELETLPNHSLVLIEEIENGLHPLAVRRLVDYLIDIAQRKNVQIVFTTHSDYALAPLPPEAIWACNEGSLPQGKLSVEVLRAVSGRIDRKLAVFVEDEFARAWIEAVLREKIGESMDEVGIYALSGDGTALKTHIGHISNPSIPFHSLCYIDGDSRQKENEENGIFRLPGQLPESTVFNSVLENLDNNIALLTIACQLSLDKQALVAKEIRAISHTNRDPHNLFSQAGIKLGFLPEYIVRGAFLAVWIQENQDQASSIAEPIRKALELPLKIA